MIVLDQDAATLAEVPPDRLLDALVFAGNVNPVKHAMVGGRWQVRDGRHSRRDDILSRYRRALASVRSRL
jgi:formimidoylglutamate deiminase